MNTYRLLFKIALFVGLLVITSAIFHILQPMVGADLAVAQLSNSDVNYFWFQVYNGIKNWSVFIFIILFVVIFYKEMILLFNLLRGKGDN